MEVRRLMSALVRRLRERTFRRLESGRILVGKRRTVRKVLERSEAPFLRAWVPSSFIESARCSWKFRHVHKHTHTHTPYGVCHTGCDFARYEAAGAAAIRQFHKRCHCKHRQFGFGPNRRRIAPPMPRNGKVAAATTAVDPSMYFLFLSHIRAE